MRITTIAAAGAVAAVLLVSLGFFGLGDREWFLRAASIAGFATFTASIAVTIKYERANKNTDSAGPLWKIMTTKEKWAAAILATTTISSLGLSFFVRVNQSLGEEPVWTFVATASVVLSLSIYTWFVEREIARRIL